MRHDELEGMLYELVDIEIRNVEKQLDTMQYGSWLEREYRNRLRSLIAARRRIAESVFVSRGHLSMTVEKDESSFQTVVTAQVARLKQEVRISEQQLLIGDHKTPRQEAYVDRMAAELREQFIQTLFDPPAPAETSPVQP
jgi:hypothetical protein